MRSKILMLLGAAAVMSAGAAQADTRVVHHNDVHRNHVVVHHKIKHAPPHRWQPPRHHAKHVVHHKVVTHADVRH